MNRRWRAKVGLINNRQTISRGIIALGVAIAAVGLRPVVEQGTVQSLFVAGTLFVAALVVILGIFFDYPIQHLARRMATQLYRHINSSNQKRQDLVDLLIKERKVRTDPPSPTDLRSIVRDLDTREVDGFLVSQFSPGTLDQDEQIAGEFKGLLDNRLARVSNSGDDALVTTLFEELITRPTLLRYSDSSEENRKRAIRSRIQRYTQRWEGGRNVTHNSQAVEPGNQEFFSYAESQIPDFVNDLLYRSDIYRLNFIKQLSTTHLWKNLGATHTRLAHTHGTVNTVGLFIESLEDIDGVEVSETEERALFLYAVLHDIFHGPFGHSLEIVRSLFVQGDERKLDKYYLSRKLDEREGVVEEVLSELDDGEEVRKYLQFFLNKRAFLEKEDHASKFAPRYFLCQVVDSPIDADRIDYLYRDFYNLKFGDGLESSLPERDAVEGMVERAGIKQTGDLTKLAFSEEDEQTVRQLLEMRSRLYSNVYTHPQKIAIDEMLAHALFYVLKSVGVQTAGEELSELDREILDEIIKLTDYQLLQFLEGLYWNFHEVSEMSSRVLNLIKGISVNDLYTPICSFPIRHSSAVEELEDISERVIQDDLAFEEVLSEFEWELNDSLFRMALVWGEGDFQDRVELENWFCHWLAKNSELGSTFKSEIGEFTNGLPHLFISLPTHIEMNLKRREDGDGSKFEVVVEELGLHRKEPEVDTVHWLEKDSEGIELGDTESDNPQRVVVCGPKFLSDDPETRAAIEDLFEEFIKTNRKHLLRADLGINKLQNGTPD